MVEMHIGQNVGHRQRMNDVRLTAAAALPFMRLFGVEIGATDQLNLRRTQVLGKPLR